MLCFLVLSSPVVILYSFIPKAVTYECLSLRLLPDNAGNMCRLTPALSQSSPHPARLAKSNTMLAPRPYSILAPGSRPSLLLVRPRRHRLLPPPAGLRRWLLLAAAILHLHVNNLSLLAFIPSHRPRRNDHGRSSSRRIGSAVKADRRLLGGDSTAEATRGAKPASAADAVLQLCDLDHVGRVDALEHELRDAVALGDGEVGVRVVEQENLDLAAVVGVDDARAGVDVVLAGEAGAGGDAAVCGKRERRC